MERNWNSTKERIARNNVSIYKQFQKYTYVIYEPKGDYNLAKSECKKNLRLLLEKSPQKRQTCASEHFIE